MYFLDIYENVWLKKMETSYYRDSWELYRDESLIKKAAKLKKYFVVDAGQLVIELIGLILMVVL